MRELKFTSMRGTEMTGPILCDAKHRGQIIQVVDRCSRIHAVCNGQSFADAPSGSDINELIARAKKEIV